MALDIRQLQVFLSVAHTGSLGRAAQALHVTQPALSRSIRQLENRLGVALFERHASGMVLTPYGESLLPHAGLMIEESTLAVEEIEALRGLSKGTARVGAVASVASGVLPRAIDRLLERWPGLQVEVLEGVNDVLAAALLRRDIDLAICVSLPANDELCVVADSGWSDSSGVVAAGNHALWKKPKLTLADLCDVRWVLPPRGTLPRDELEALFAANSLSAPRVLVETRSVVAIKELVLQTDFVGKLPLPLCESECRAGTLRVLPVAGTHQDRRFFVFRRRKGLLPRPAAQLLAELRRVTTPLQVEDR